MIYSIHAIDHKYQDNYEKQDKLEKSLGTY